MEPNVHSEPRAPLLRASDSAVLLGLFLQKNPRKTPRSAPVAITPKALSQDAISGIETERPVRSESRSIQDATAVNAPAAPEAITNMNRPLTEEGSSRSNALQTIQ